MFNKIIKAAIYLLVFLVPMFWLGFSFEAFEFNKQYLLFFLVSAAFLAWLAKMIVYDKEIRFKRTPLDLPILLFLFIAILSAIFSVDKGSSLFGFYGRFSDGLIGLLSLGMFYFLITNNVSISRNGRETTRETNAKKISVNGLLKVFLWSVGFVVLFSYFSIFGVWQKLSLIAKNLSFDLPAVMMQSTFNPVAGSMEGLAIFLSVVVVLLVGLMLQKSQISNWILLLGSLGLLILIDFSAGWGVLVVSLLLFVGFALWKRMFKEQVNKLLLPIFLIIMGVLFLFVNTTELSPNLPKEQVLSQGISWQVSAKSATENVKAGFLGSGIGTFHYDFAKFKPASFNQTNFWQIRFDRAGSHIAETLGTMGFLGVLSWLSIIGMFLLISWIIAAKKFSELPLLMVMAALVIAQMVYYQNTVLAFSFWLFLGLSVVAWQKPIKEKVISFKEMPEIALVFNVLFLVIVLSFLFLYFFGAKFYLADTKYKQSRSAVELEQVVRLNPYCVQYPIILSRFYLQDALQGRGEIQTKVAQAINVGKRATELAPNRVAAWETLGMIYRDIQGVAAGALNWGQKSFETAIKLEPSNPVLWTELGKLHLIADENERARQCFDKAIEIKSDYIEAHIQMILILESEDKSGEAVKEMETLAGAFPFNTEVLFQLGRLYLNADQISDAILQFEKVITMFPNHSNALYSLGVAYTIRGETKKAISVFERVLELNPENLDVLEKIEELRK